MDKDSIYAAPVAELFDSTNADVKPLAGRWARLGGSIVDNILVSLIVFPVVYYFLFFSETVLADQPVVILASSAVVLGIVAHLLLNGYLLAKHGQTIGKRLVGTRIVSIHDNQILSLSKVFTVRYLPFTLAAYIPGIGSFLPFIDGLFVFRDDKRCLHDLVAGTKVVVAK